MQHSRLRLIDLNYYCHRDIKQPEKVLEIHAFSDGYAFPLNEIMEVQLVKHADINTSYKTNNLLFRFFKSKNNFWYIPFATHRYIKQQKPDFILVQGFVFPVQLIALKLLLGKRTKILVQHHGELPFSGYKKIVQKMADKFISAYLFTGIGNAKEWIEGGVIPHKKCFEIQAASTCFTPLQKAACKAELNIIASTNFLWVGHLTPLKDPVTVVNAFAQYLESNSGAALYFIYQSTMLLDELKKIVANSDSLQKSVHFIGYVSHKQLQKWYSACDYFISGSHRESCGYSLLEAIACGCIPVVTAIPSFTKITDNGRLGFLYESGNTKALYSILNHLNEVNTETFSHAVKEYFTSHLSFKKISADIIECCQKLKTE